MKKLLLRLFPLLCVGCTHQPSAPSLRISLINNNHSVKLKGLDYAIISEINRDSVPGSWQSLIPVYRMPADTGVKDYQPPQPGVYVLRDSAVVFTPDTAFVNGKTYFIRCYQFNGDKSLMDYMRGKNKLGNIKYTDLIFK